MWVVEAFDEDGEYVAYSQEAYVSEKDARRAAEERAAEQPEYTWEVRYVEKQTADPERPYTEV